MYMFYESEINIGLPNDLDLIFTRTVFSLMAAIVLPYECE